MIARSPEPILAPIAPYEHEGLLPDIVFSCGHVALDDAGQHIRVYYGAADCCLAAADIRVRDIIDQMQPC